ncbi:MAG: hypothetical protein LUC38_09570 [Oscillospiraceae bacterium]|nr:hypothetical protein [Ruminococcus sp.]MCD8346178.1 hypothetical protein [Oscillospiraceae bacterium]
MTNPEEEYIRAEKRMKLALQGAEDVIRYYRRSENPEEYAAIINRGCRIYEAVNMVMDKMPEQELQNRMLYFHEIEGIFNALCLAQGLITEEDLPEEESRYYQNHDWIVSLARLFEDHWDMKKRYLEMDFEAG